MMELGFRPKPIDMNFFEHTEDYPITGMHNGHRVRAEGMQRTDQLGNPYPTRLGIHGTNVAVDWESCIADGACMAVCPSHGFEWYLNRGKTGKGNDLKLEEGSELWEKFRTDKADPVGQDYCVFCNACVAACPSGAISVLKRM